jgi:lysophospholipase L1-like esterase
MAIGSSPPAAAAVSGPVRIMALGDSLTQGVSYDGAYRAALATDLAASHREVDFVGSLQDGPPSMTDRDHEGHGGWRIDQIDAIVQDRLATYRPDIVLLTIGTNDLIQDHDVPGAPQRLAGLVDDIEAAAPMVEVYVSSIPPIDNPAVQPLVDTYDAAVRALVPGRPDDGQVHFVDSGAAVTVDHLVDGVHPDIAGYDAMGHAWFEAIAADIPVDAGARSSGHIVGGVLTGDGQGTWLAGADGSVATAGNAPYLGSASGLKLRAPIVGLARTPSSGGYWLLGGDGGIFTYGNAAFSGSTGGMTLRRPVVGLAADPDGTGYWLVASDGGVFSFDAPFFGSTGSLTLQRPVVGMAATPTGRGYWLVASDGGVFSFGDAAFAGSTGGIRLQAPVVAMAPDPDGHGYWLAASDGGVFSFDAAFRGSGAGQLAPGDHVVSIDPYPAGGYALVTTTGRVLPFRA